MTEHLLHTGHVGPPILCNKIKLVDVPEMDYYAKDGKGEVNICFSPPGVSVLFTSSFYQIYYTHPV